MKLIEIHKYIFHSGIDRIITLDNIEFAEGRIKQLNETVLTGYFYGVIIYKNKEDL